MGIIGTICEDCICRDKSPYGEPCNECAGEYYERDTTVKTMEAKLLEALKLIRDECNKHDDCIGCPLRDIDNNCELSVRPDKWKFNDEEPKPKRLFL